MDKREYRLERDLCTRCGKYVSDGAGISELIDDEWHRFCTYPIGKSCWEKRCKEVDPDPNDE